MTRYAENGASSRCRSYQFLPGIRARGFRADVRPLLPESYLNRQYEGGRRFAKFCEGGAALARRWLQRDLLKNYDVVVVEKELYPFVPFALEALDLRFASRLIVDYDDAVWVSYKPYCHLRNKIQKVIECSDAVMVGSRYLEEYAKTFNSSVHFIPTVVDLRRYRPKSSPVRGGGPIRIGWIGTPVTLKFLPQIREVIHRIASRCPIICVTIGGGDATVFPGVLTRSIPWTYESEAELLRDLDVGIMPLRDDEFARGKCGYKLIQYMAAGLPTVASDVGENRNIVAHGETGFLARTPEEWEKYLLELCASPELRERMGAAGRRRAEERYHLDLALDRMSEVLAEACDRDPKMRLSAD